MKDFFVRFFFVTSLVFASALAFADDPPSPTPPNPHPQKSEAKTPISVTAKLYAIARVMDNHENWGVISDMLRTILTEDLDNDFVRARLKKVKKYVDRENLRQTKSKFLGTRLDTHSFLEARLLIVECLQEMRPRLNRSWTGEVRLLRKMVFTALFPHAEQFGEIEFPEPSTYSFDAYGYTLKNLQALMVNAGGEKLAPLFDEFMLPPKRQFDDSIDDIGSTMAFKKLTYLKERIFSELKAEGISESWNPEDEPSGGSFRVDPWGDDDDFYFPYPGGGEEKIFLLKRAYRMVSKFLTMLRNHKSYDEYEPLTLLMIGIANPNLLNEDQQLADFFKGVKFKVKVAETGGEIAPAEYEWVKLANDALVPNAGAKLQYEVDSKTGRGVLYFISNVNGDTSVAGNVLSVRNVTMFLQAAKHIPDGLLGTFQSTPEGIAKLIAEVNEALQKMNASDTGNWLYRLVGAPAQAVFDIVVKFGGGTIQIAAKNVSEFLQAQVKKPVVSKTLTVLKSEKLIKSLVIVSVAMDVTGGTLEFIHATTPGLRPKVAIRTISKVGGTLLYLSKNPRVIWPAVIFDVGHLFYDKIPSTSQVIEGGLTFGYNKVYTLVNGYSPRQKELRELKKQLLIHDNDATQILTEFQARTDAATELKDLELAQTKLSQSLSEYAAKRLVFHYVAVTALNGKGDHDLGKELKNFARDYDHLYDVWYNTPGLAVQEQLGLASLDRVFWKKWVDKGGKLPEAAETPETDRPNNPDSEKTPPPAEDDGLPWEDISGNSKTSAAVAH